MKANLLAIGLFLALAGPLHAYCQDEQQRDECVFEEQTDAEQSRECRRIILYNPDIYQNSYIKDPVERGPQWPSSHASSFYDEFTK